MLKMFVSRGPDRFLPIEHAQRYDQRPFRSMLVQGWVAYRPNKGFHVTDKGLERWHQLTHVNNKRVNPYGRLTAYFDQDAYGIGKKGLSVMRKAPAQAAA